MRQMTSSLAWAYVCYHMDETGYAELANLAQTFVQTSFLLDDNNVISASNFKIHKELSRFFAYHRLLCKLT